MILLIIICEFSYEQFLFLVTFPASLLPDVYDYFFVLTFHFFLLGVCFLFPSILSLIFLLLPSFTSLQVLKLYILITLYFTTVRFQIFLIKR